MSSNLVLRKVFAAVLYFSIVFLVFTESGLAADALSYFKNYFVTGDYVAAGVGLRGTGVNGFATGTINLSGVPCTAGNPAAYVPCSTPGALPADVVAAFLYWETEETAPNPAATNGFFDGNAIVGKVLGDPNNPACWSSGGTTGSGNGAGRVYRSDVLRFLAIDDVHNVRLANGPHTVKLADSGGNGNGNIFLTGGATLVVVYRVVVPGQPLFAPIRAVISYDGAYSSGKGSQPMTLNVGGFYQASNNPLARMTPIVANGQPDFVETLSVNGTALPGIPFTGAAGVRWDNPTFSIGLAQNSSSYSTQVTLNNNQTCLTFVSLWTSMNVTDTDHDGLLDRWELNGLHLNPGNSTQPATFGGCLDYPSEPCVNLPAMGADFQKRDIFVELDWEHGTDGHLHIPKYAALSVIGETFKNNSIAMHFDVGNNYQGQQFIIPAGLAQGGEVIEESSLLCPNVVVTTCTFSEPYSVLSWKRGFHAIKDGFPILNIPAHFARNRKDIFHYVLFAHALAGLFDATGNPVSPDPKSVSGVADRPGGDALITLGLWRADDLVGCDASVNCADQTGSDQVQAGTLMHELGHNLDLSHAGVYRVPQCMPNYMSVMNYLYQTRGLTDADGNEHIDYSHKTLLPLDEGSLSKAPGSMGPLSYRVRFFGPAQDGEGAAIAHCDGSSITDGAMAVRLEGETVSTPDWNRSGSTADGPVSFDVNFSGVLEDGVSGTTFFIDSDDWNSLNLQQVSARVNVNGLSADIGAADLGAADLGAADLGAADLGAADLGAADLGAADLGAADLGAADLGDVDYDAVISSIDATSASGPLKASNKADKVGLTWGSPFGQIRHYNIYRSDPAHPTPLFLNHIDGVPPATLYDDVVNDFTHAGAACPNNATCYNTLYTYYQTAVDVNGTESARSNKVVSEVTHLFVIPDDQSAVYGNSFQPLKYSIYGDFAGSLSGVTCAFTISPAVPRNVGTYAITCSGPSSTSPTDGVTYNVSYNDGVNHVAGSLTITPRPITVTAVASTKVYDGGTSSPATPILTSGSLVTPDTAAFSETYDNKNVGVSHVMTPSGGVNDGNGGNNYKLTVATINTGVITKANPVVTVAGYNIIYDGAPHTATGTAKGVLGETLNGLDLAGTTHVNAADYLNDPWVFTDSTGNYFNAGGTVHDKINPAPQTITFLPLADKFLGNPPFALSAVASSGLPVTFTSNSTGICTVSGNTVTLVGAGTCSITASQSGNGNYLPATPVTQPFHVTGFVATASMTTARSFHTATQLANGKVLVAGGLSSSGSPLASAEIYDPVARTFTPTGNNMPNKAAGHTATLLNDGRVIVVGGGNSSSEIYDPSTNTWSSQGGISGQRTYHSATLLPNGKVLVAGGSDNSGKTTNTAQLFDPATGNYINTGNMTVSRDFHTATLLPNGKVLIAGGRTVTGSSTIYQASTEIYDPATGVFTAAASMSSGRYGHTAVVFNGKVLIAGGANTGTVASADLYDPSSGNFASTGSMASGRQYFTATIFGGNTVVEIGGLKGTTRLASSELYQSSAFQSGPNMTAPRSAHTATLLNDGSVLVTGGQGSNGNSVATSELLK